MLAAQRLTARRLVAIVAADISRRARTISRCTASIGLRPRDEAVPIEQMDPLTRGALFHAVQFALLGELNDRALLPVNARRLAEALELADRALDQVAAKYEEELAPAIERVWTTEIEDLRTDLRGWLQHVAVNDDEWKPVHFEFAFGLPRGFRSRCGEYRLEVAELDAAFACAGPSTWWSATFRAACCA